MQHHYQGLQDLLNSFIRVANPATALLDRGCYGDWIDVDPRQVRTPSGSVTAFYYFYALQYMREIADIIGEEKDAAHYVSLWDAAKASYHTAYFNATAG